MSRTLALLVWLVLVGTVWVFAPRDEVSVYSWVLEQIAFRSSMKGNWVVAWFWLLGIWPALVGLLLRSDWNARPPAWPFVLGSFFLGCYVLLPWFVIRREPRRVREDGWFDRWDIPVGIVFVALFLVAWATASGHPSEIYHAVLTNGVAFAMAGDSLAFWALSILEARERSQRTSWLITIIPLIGLGIFLALEEARRKGT